MPEITFVFGPSDSFFFDCPKAWKLYVMSTLCTRVELTVRTAMASPTRSDSCSIAPCNRPGGLRNRTVSLLRLA
jgi:hypothetical protein